MSRKRKYINDDLTISDKFITVLRNEFEVAEGITDEALRQEYNVGLLEVLEIIRQKLRDDLLVAHQVLEGNGIAPPSNIYPLKLTTEYVLHQLNNYLKNQLGYYESPEQFAKDLADEETGFLINWNCKNLVHLGKQITDASNPLELLQYYNKQLYQIQNDENLVEKLERGNKNKYLKFLKRSITYLLANSKIEVSAHLDKNALNQTAIELTHRMHALIHLYKAKAKYVPHHFSPSEVERLHGAKRKQAYYSTWPENGKTYVPAKKHELETIIPQLADYPNAQKAAINDLDMLISLD